MFGYKLATALFLAIFLRGCDGKIVVDHVPAPVTPGNEVPANGVLYALPNTVIRMQVKLDKTERSGARFAPYAAIFAPGLTPVCEDGDCTKEGKITYSLQDGTTFSTYGEPDPQNVYLVRFMGKGAIDQTFSMNWNELGILSSASATVTNRTGDIVVSALKVAAGLGTKAALGSADVVGQPLQCKYDPSATDKDIIPVLRKDLSVSGIFETNYCALSKDARDKLPHGASDLKLLEGAVDAYIDRVKSLVLTRNKILEGKYTFPEPASLLSHVESEINEQLKFLYVGSKGTITWDGVLDVHNVVEGSPLTVMRIDKNGGVCLTSEVVVPPSTKPMPTSMTPKPGKFTQLVDAACSAARPIDLTLKYYPDKDKQLFTKIKDVTEGDRSFRYRVAAQVQAVLSDADSTYGSGFFSVAQLGKVISLPASRHSKTITYELSFIESTGALKTFKLGTAGGLDAATIEALGGVGGTLLDARRTETETLTMQYQLLKLKDDICTIQKKYNLPCTVEPK